MDNRPITNALRERFIVFSKSSFSKNRKDELFAYIWDRYRRKISYYIYNVLPVPHPQPEDLFQDVMLKIYSHLHTFDPASSFKAWIYVIARNHCLDVIKSCADKLAALETPLDGDIPGGSDPEQEVVRKDLHEKVAVCIQGFKPIDREIAYLHFYENMKYREIGRITGFNLNNVKAHIHLIKVRLRKDLRRVL